MVRVESMSEWTNPSGVMLGVTYNIYDTATGLHMDMMLVLIKHSHKSVNLCIQI